MYRHIKKYEIKYTDVDAFDNLKLSALLGIMQESASFSADELGFGYSEIVKKDIAFILANWYAEIYRPIKQGEVLEVHTWPLKPVHFIFLRDFELYCGGEKVGAASSRWCMINLKTFKMLPINAFFEEGFFDNYNTERSVNFNAWKIAGAEGETAYSRRVCLSDYDHYFHVNNTKYADYLLDAFSLDEIKGKFVKSVQITYIKQCKQGEIIEFTKSDCGEFYLVVGSVNGEPRVQFKVAFNEI